MGHVPDFLEFPPNPEAILCTPNGIYIVERHPIYLILWTTLPISGFSTYSQNICHLPFHIVKLMPSQNGTYTRKSDAASHFRNGL